VKVFYLWISSLNESQLSYLDTVRKFVKNEITPIFWKWKKNMFSLEYHQQGLENRFDKLSIPESVRGYELTPLLPP